MMKKYENDSRTKVAFMELKNMNQNEINENVLSSSFNDSYTPSIFQPSTWQPVWFSYNSNASEVGNTNASRHFADYPESSGVLGIEAIIIVVVVSLIPVSVIACMIFVISFNCLKRRGSLLSTVSLNETEKGKEVTDRLRKCELKLKSKHENVKDRTAAQNDDEGTMIDTPLSIYPGDFFSDELDNSKISLATPISNNSIITMTMRNNHLIVETEERIPCSLLNGEQIYCYDTDNLPKSCVQYDIHEYKHNQLFDEIDYYGENYNEEHSGYRQGCTVCGHETELLYKPSSSRQVDEEDSQVELFHKNLLIFATDRTTACDIIDAEGESPVVGCNPSYTNSDFHVEPSLPLTHSLIVNTGYSQSDSTVSSMSNLQCGQITDYSYGNQSEYVTTDFPFRKRCALGNVLITDVDVNRSTVGLISLSTNTDTTSFSDSVP